MKWSTEASVVALGGGHGLAASLTALRSLTTDLTAVVTVADNGGSSGRLRQEFGVLPPGDLRMALAALCGDDRWGQTWARVLQHRFESEGEMNGHSMGNLLIVTLWDLLHDHVDGLDWVAGLLGARGRVLPMATTPLDITAEVRGAGADPDAVSTVRGQVEVATTPGEVLSVALDPADAPACPEAVTAIMEADWVVLGPGSWYTSVLPHLLVPGLRDALCRTPARVVVSMNLEPHTEETRGYDLADHLEVMLRLAPDLRIHAAVVDPTAVRDRGRLGALTDRSGARLVVEDVRSRRQGVHDPQKLGSAYARLFEKT
ncbi:MAG: uridine diphosphate-N-acetylglucosamine-binding protein YvcK [Marmoricola sp.]|nr:uridine diphosphate-N-acetylglucosamine-binding protein YvcK [Marmoricola sp.]